MNTYEIIAVVAIIILLVLAIYFVTAKGDRRKVTITNADGSSVVVDAEIANTTATRAKGLMGRSSLGETEGMLFVFDKPGVYPFWMFNTTIPLEAIHVSENGTVVDIIEMEPCGITACKLYPPKAPALYVLEVNQNFSQKHGVQVGSSLK
jgi:uncharacterized protein